MIIHILIIILNLGWQSDSAIKLQQDPGWKVPESAKNVENPTDPLDEENIEIGKELYMLNCKSCHGDTGLGDGPLAKSFQQKIANLNSKTIQSQTDGSIYYKISTGRGLMPDFSKRIIEDEDRWLLVNYIRSLPKE